MDALTATSWPCVAEEQVLLQPHEVRTSWREFMSTSNVLVQQVMGGNERGWVVGGREGGLTRRAGDRGCYEQGVVREGWESSRHGMERDRDYPLAVIRGLEEGRLAGLGGGHEAASSSWC